MIQNLQHDIPEDKHCMSEEEVKELRQALKKKWEEINKVYQSITHISKVDTIGLKRKKETCEKEMAEIEKDIKKLNKLYVFVEAE
jgi:thymidylate synthase ThyX